MLRQRLVTDEFEPSKIASHRTCSPWWFVFFTDKTFQAYYLKVDGAIKPVAISPESFAFPSLLFDVGIINREELAEALEAKDRQNMSSFSTVK